MINRYFVSVVQFDNGQITIAISRSLRLFRLVSEGLSICANGEGNHRAGFLPSPEPGAGVDGATVGNESRLMRTPGRRKDDGIVSERRIDVAQWRKKIA